MLRYVGRASLQCGKDTHHHRNGALQEEGDVITSGYAVLREQGREAVRLAIEILVSDRFIQMLDGNGLRVGGSVCFEGVVDAGVGQRDEWALTKALKENLIELRQVAHGLS